MPKPIDNRYGIEAHWGRDFRAGGHELLMATGTDAKRASASAFLPGVIAFAGLAAVWFAINQNGPRGPLVLGWISPPVTLALAARAMCRTAAAPGLPSAARRFWHQISLVAAACGMGMVIQGVYAVAGLTSPALKVPPPAGVFYVGGVVYAVWALLRVPVGARSRSEWIRLSLDCATVVLGAAVFMWYVGFGPLLTTGGAAVIWAPVSVGLVALVGVAAVTKIVLAGAGPVDMSALRMLGLALLVGGISAGTATMIATQPHLIPAQVSVPLISVVLVLAAERQHRALTAERPVHRPRLMHPVSLLPYAAVVGTDALLVLATIGRADGRRYVVVAGAITITALVAVRQIVAFADNARLVDRLRHQEDRLRHQASHDTLTQLANRELFAEQLDAALAAGAGLRGDLTVLLIDLDDFKTVNDTLGHSVGDRLLAAVAQRVGGCVRPDETVARLGGDEFAVLLRQAWPAAVDGVAEHILATLRRPIVVDGYELLVQASIGVTDARPGDNPDMLLRNADIAMYAAKERGKGSFARYVPGMAADVLRHAEVGAQLRQAIEDDQLKLLYQPVVRLTDGRIIGMEALVRWHHPIAGEISPLDFIPTAERTGLIVPLGRWVLREACRQKAAWRAAHGDTSPATIGVNVSGRQLQEPGFADEVADAVHEAGLEPRNLVLEVTETAVLTGGQSLDTIRALHDFGVSLALDDFGTGQSSLGLISTCPVHILKLDKSFVTGCPDDIGTADKQIAVAAAVVHIANDLGLDAVAEGIESQAQEDRMAKLGYKLGQGFHLVPPLPADQLAQLLAREAVAFREVASQ
jgi:diguanylate cyclase (GGDEF)-like protein